MKTKEEKTKKGKTGVKPRRGQLSAEAMLAFAAYAALVAAFVFAARQAGDAATPKTQAAYASLRAAGACAVIEYAALNERHSKTDLPSLTVTVEETENAECAVNARRQGENGEYGIAVKENEKEQV